MTIRDDERKLLSHDLDETDMFFLSLAKTTKAFPPIEQAKVKLQISQTILQTQIAIDEQAYHLSLPTSYVSMHNEAPMSRHFGVQNLDT